MIVVIQCAGSKQRDADKKCLKTVRGKLVHFVARPKLAPLHDDLVYARPDDLSDNGMSWRRVLLNEQAGANPLGLYPAWQLYKDKTYGRLVKCLGSQKVYVLSAGWGLIRANFLTPYYDITFSTKAEKYKRRGKKDHYCDFRMLPEDNDEPIVFFGSANYVPLFCCLTQASKCKKTVFYNSKYEPEAPRCWLQQFDAKGKNTNWQYDCANAFLDGKISVG
jgi:hypothetical protein